MWGCVNGSRTGVGVGRPTGRTARQAGATDHSRGQHSANSLNMPGGQ